MRIRDFSLRPPPPQTAAAARRRPSLTPSQRFSSPLPPPSPRPSSLDAGDGEPPPRQVPEPEQAPQGAVSPASQARPEAAIPTAPLLDLNRYLSALVMQIREQPDGVLLDGDRGSLHHRAGDLIQISCQFFLYARTRS